MIRYALRCDHDHAFESWFQDSSAYDAQVKRKLVSCPVCGSDKIEKAIMAPRIVGKKGRERGEPAPPAPVPATPAPAEAPAVAASTPLMMAQERELRAKLKELRDHIVKNADNAGPSPSSGWTEDFHLQAVVHTRHTANGSRERAPDDRLREAIQGCARDSGLLRRLRSSQ